MAIIDADFDWPRALRYELARSKQGQVIRQTSANTERIWPLRHNTKLYLEFANLEPKAEAYLTFARRWGFLGFKGKGADHPAIPTPPKKGAEERVEDWRSEIEFMKQWLRALGGDYGGQLNQLLRTRGAAGGRTRTRITDIEVLLAEEPEGHRALVLRPPSLLNAMKLQLAQSAGGGKDIKTCPRCGKWFEAGAEAKRSVARFCSDRCRNQFHRNGTRP
jgi:hypothetical protein